MENEIIGILKDYWWDRKLPKHKGTHEKEIKFTDCISSFDAPFDELEISFKYDIVQDGDIRGKWLAYQYCYDFEIIVDDNKINSKIVEDTIEEIVSKEMN